MEREEWAMLLELDKLNEKATQLAQLTAQLRQENVTLRNQLLQNQRENSLLQQRLLAAATQVETLIKRLPEDANTGQSAATAEL
jgi:hypothetical protein